MNFYHKVLVVIFVVILQSSTAWSIEKSIYTQDIIKDPCVDARFGNLDLESVEYHNSSYSSYMFKCSIAVFIPFINESYESIKKRRKKKLMLANVFIEKGLDVKYTDEIGSSLIMLVIRSSLPEDWKLKVIKILIGKGCDIYAKNIYGFTAMDFAKSRKNKNIIKFLAKYTH